MKTYEPEAGENITTTASNMIAQANQSGESVSATFNGVPLEAKPGASADDIAARYMTDLEQRAEAYRRSPEGLRQAAEAAAFQRQADLAAAEGIKPFAVKDAEAWRSWTENNVDPYGACCVRYAARWANLMEARMATGATLRDIADETSHEADVEGITGFMYGAAVSMLARAWEHGEELRRWHNLKTQIGNEGEKANESGGTLNPALLNIGT